MTWVCGFGVSDSDVEFEVDSIGCEVWVCVIRVCGFGASDSGLEFWRE